jgi:energy-converting hydrogenase Eha subunit A
VILEFGGNVTPVHSKAELKSVISNESKSLEREIKGQLSRTQILAIILPLIVAIITIISMSFGVASQITPERKVFQSSILFGVPLILLGGYFMYLWYERIGEREIFINRHEKKIIPIYKRSEKQRKMFLIIGILIILLGISIIVWGSLYAADSPFISTPTPTTVTPTYTPTPSATNTVTSTTTPTASRTVMPTKTITATP